MSINEDECFTISSIPSSCVDINTRQYALTCIIIRVHS